MPGLRLGVARALLALTVAVVGTVSVSHVAAAAESTALSPSMTVSPVSISAGDKVTVRGQGWPEGQLVDLSICGNGGDGGSANCNRSGAATIGVGSDGEFGATILGVIPPVACPCVVRGVAGVYTATQPLEVVGAPLRTAPEAIAVPVVASVVVTGSGPPAAWFGGSPERDVVVGITNPSAGVVKGLKVELRWGDEGSEQSTVIPLGEDLPARTTTQVTTTITLGALTWGDVEVRARVVTTGDPTWVSASTSSYPWGLILIAFVLLQVVVIVIVRRNRRRRREREAEQAAMDDGEVVDGSGAASLAEPGADADSSPPVTADGDPSDVPADAGLVGAVTAAAGGAAVGTIRRTDTEADVDESSAAAVQQPMTGPVTAAPWTRPRR